MIRLLIATLIIFLASHFAHAQGEVQMYRDIYKAADSLPRNGRTGVVDTSVYKLAADLDKEHPAGYFDAATKFMADRHFNEAAFMFYLGQLRFKYYNATNPAYKASDDGALSGALSYVVGEPINMYLRADADNFIGILHLSLKYYQEHDYKFFPRSKSPENYQAQADGISGLIAAIEKDKEQNKQKWAEERQHMEQSFDAM